MKGTQKRQTGSTQVSQHETYNFRLENAMQYFRRRCRRRLAVVAMFSVYDCMVMVSTGARHSTRRIARATFVPRFAYIFICAFGAQTKGLRVIQFEYERQRRRGYPFPLFAVSAKCPDTHTQLAQDTHTPYVHSN